jgi:tetratricopeptide (TPR) repeat protein
MDDVESNSPLQLEERGKEEYAKGNFAAAADLFAESAQAYAAAQDELKAAEMKNNQSVALLQGGRAQEALEATDGTEAVFQKAGDLKRQGIAVSNRAAALEALKKADEALSEYERAAALLEQAGEGDMHSLVRKTAANLNLKRGRITAAQMDVYDSLRLVEKPSFTQRVLKFFRRIGFIK